MAPESCAAPGCAAVVALASLRCSPSNRPTNSCSSWGLGLPVYATFMTAALSSLTLLFLLARHLLVASATAACFAFHASASLALASSLFMSSSADSRTMRPNRSELRTLTRSLKSMNSSTSARLPRRVRARESFAL